MSLWYQQALIQDVRVINFVLNLSFVYFKPIAVEKKEEHRKIAFKPETFQTNANNCECHFLNAKDPFLICEHDFEVEKENNSDW